MKSLHSLLLRILQIALILFCISCDHGPVYEKYLKMKDSVWDRFDQKYFEVPIEQAPGNYDITLVVHNDHKFGYDNLPLYVILSTPAGEERIREISIPVRQSGKMTGTIVGNLFENRLKVWKNLKLEGKGKYRISLENMIPKIQTAGIDEIGILVTKSD
jgi:gliding motility-associated lipoprotein GldH